MSGLQRGRRPVPACSRGATAVSGRRGPSAIRPDGRSRCRSARTSESSSRWHRPGAAAAGSRGRASLPTRAVAQPCLRTGSRALSRSRASKSSRTRQAGPSPSGRCAHRVAVASTSSLRQVPQSAAKRPWCRQKSARGSAVPAQAGVIPPGPLRGREPPNAARLTNVVPTTTFVNHVVVRTTPRRRSPASPRRRPRPASAARRARPPAPGSRRSGRATAARSSRAGRSR
jgi:hypothetical protein